MPRSFRYHTSVEELRRFIERMGFAIEELAGSNPTEGAGFLIRNTHIMVNYPEQQWGRVVALGEVTLQSEEASPVRKQQSWTLFQHLQQKFATQ